MTLKKLIKGALWLTLTGVALRIVGMGFRIFISGRLGEEGMGLHQLIWSVYMLASAFASAGVSVAVTRLVSAQTVSGGKDSIRRIMRFSLTWSMSIGVLVAMVLCLGASGVAGHLIHDFRATASLRLLALGLPFMAGAACFNGYFLAVGKVQYSCLSQVAEQVIRILLCLVLLAHADTVSVAHNCAIISFGNVVSEISATTILFLFYRAHQKTLAPSHCGKSNVFSQFLPIQFPIAVSKYITGSLHTAENLLVPLQLGKSLSRSLALSSFGALKGMALPLIMFPSAFLGSLAGLLVPELNAASVRGHRAQIQKITRRTLHVTFIFSIMMGGLFYRFGKGLGELVYHSKNVGDILCFLSPVIPFMYLDCITDNLLKGIGEQVACLRYSTGDSLMRILLVWLLLPRYGMRGFLYIMALSNVTISLLGLRRLVRTTECPVPWLRSLILPILSVLCAILFSRPFHSLWLGGTVFAAVYIALLGLGGALKKESLFG